MSTGLKPHEIDQQAQEHYREGFLISTDSDRLDLGVIHDFLANEAYWCKGIARETVERFIQHSLCFGVYACAKEGNGQVGFARAVTDFTTFAYIADLFILRPYRRQGLGKWLVACMLAHPELQNLRKWALNTQDAHGLYRRFGFNPGPYPENYLVFRP